MSEFTRQEKRYTTILDSLKVTILFPIGILAYTLEKLAPKISLIYSCVYYGIIIASAIGIGCAAIAMAASAAGIVRAQKKDQQTLVEVKSIVTKTATIHYYCLALAAVALLFTLVWYSEVIYKEESKVVLKCEVTKSVPQPSSDKWKIEIICDE